MQRPHEIDRFDDYRDTNTVQEQSPNPAQARHLREHSRSKVKTMETLNLTEETATDYFENLYEACRMLIQGQMAAAGYKPYSHEAIIAYAIDKLDIVIEEAEAITDLYEELRSTIAGDA